MDDDSFLFQIGDLIQLNHWNSLEIGIITGRIKHGQATLYIVSLQNTDKWTELEYLFYEYELRALE